MNRRLIELFVLIAGVVVSALLVFTDNLLSKQLVSGQVDLKIPTMLILMMLSFLIAIAVQQYDSQTQLDRYQTSLYAKLDDIANVASDLISLGDDRKVFEELIELAARAKTAYSKEPIALEQMRCILRESKGRMKDLSRGSFNTYFWNCSILANAVREMESEMIGLSPWHTTDENWWESNDGRKFFNVNKEIAGNGRRIVRIFLYENEDELLQQELLKHHNANVEVYRISRQELGKAGFKADTDAMAVIDGKLAFWGDTHNKSLYPDRNYFSFNREEVRTRRQQLERILENSVRFEPPAAAAGNGDKDRRAETDE